MVNRSGGLYIDAETRAIYFGIREKYSNLKLTNSDIFSLALAMGYLNDEKKQLIRKNAFIRHETIPTNLFSQMILIAISEFGENSDEWINDPFIILSIAEEYANGGIMILERFLQDYETDLAKELSQIILKLDEDYELTLKYQEFFEK